VFDVPRDLEDHMVTHESWLKLIIVAGLYLSIQRVYAYVGHSYFIWNIHWHLHVSN
jgi:hypothetical protein